MGLPSTIYPHVESKRHLPFGVSAQNSISTADSPLPRSWRVACHGTFEYSQESQAEGEGSSTIDPVSSAICYKWIVRKADANQELKVCLAASPWGLPAQYFRWSVSFQQQVAHIISYAVGARVLFTGYMQHSRVWGRSIACMDGSI